MKKTDTFIRFVLNEKDKRAKLAYRNGRFDCNNFLEDAKFRKFLEKKGFDLNNKIQVAYWLKESGYIFYQETK